MSSSTGFTFVTSGGPRLEKQQDKLMRAHVTKRNFAERRKRHHEEHLLHAGRKDGDGPRNRSLQPKVSQHTMFSLALPVHIVSTQCMVMLNLDNSRDQFHRRRLGLARASRIGDHRAARLSLPPTREVRKMGIQKPSRTGHIIIPWPCKRIPQIRTCQSTFVGT